MERISDPADLGSTPGPIVLAAGYLDGVHQGHRAVLAKAVAEAKRIGGTAWVLTIDPHPGKVLRPQAAPAILTDLEKRLSLISETGVDGVVLLRFTRDLSQCEPEPFLDRLLRQAPQIREIVVGENWRFGRQARGDIALLRRFAGPAGIAVHVVTPVLWEGIPVSSSRIRKAVEEGHVEAAAQMLGRPFDIPGTVKHGKSLGRDMGFPTANIEPRNEVRPAPGVYAVRITGLDVPRGGAAYYGSRPTLKDGRPPDLEVHIFDLDLDLYGRSLDVHFLARLREDLVFSSREALVGQIRKDVASARDLVMRFPEP